MKLIPVALLAGSVALLLSGCIYVPVPVPAGSPVAQGPGPVASTDCGGANVTIDSKSPSYVLTGNCPLVSVQGNGLIVTIGDVQSLELNGDNLQVTARKAGNVSIGGNDNAVNADSLGGITINGDRNTLGTATVSGVTIGGNDNTIHATVTGEVVQNGDRNTIGK